MVLALLVPLSGCGCGKPDVETLQFSTRNDQRRIDDRSQPGPSQQDSLVVEGEIREGGRPVGRFDIRDVTTDVDAIRERKLGHMVLSWDDGSRLMASGANDFPIGGGIPARTIEWVVIGGTGRRFAARGVCRANHSGGEFRWRCSLRR